MSIAALQARQSGKAAAPARLVGLYAANLPETPGSVSPPGRKSHSARYTHCPSARYDAWLGFAMLDSTVLQAGQTFDLHTDRGILRHSGQNCRLILHTAGPGAHRPVSGA
ncbi:MAG: hypothetical protein R3E89_18655 [Thiolinea sp.]